MQAGIKHIPTPHVQKMVLWSSLPHDTPITITGRFLDDDSPVWFTHLANDTVFNRVARSSGAINGVPGYIVTSRPGCIALAAAYPGGGWTWFVRLATARP